MTSIKNLSQTGLSILVMSWLPVILGCNLEGMQDCVFNDELKHPQLSVIFTPDFTEHSKTCQRQVIFLACAWQESLIKGCSRRELAGLTAFDNVNKAACQLNIKAYNRSRSCFMEIQTEVLKCLNIFKRANEDHCLELEETRECVRNSVNKDFCDNEDKMFMGKITDLSLNPYAHPEFYNCKMANFEDEKETTSEAKISETAITTPTKVKILVSTSEVTFVANTDKVNSAASNGTLRMVMTDESNSIRHSADEAFVVALFVSFMFVKVVC